MKRFWFRLSTLFCLHKGKVGRYLRSNYKRIPLRQFNRYCVSWRRSLEFEMGILYLYRREFVLQHFQNMFFTNRRTKCIERSVYEPQVNKSWIFYTYSSVISTITQRIYSMIHDNFVYIVLCNTCGLQSDIDDTQCFCILS